MFTQRLKVAFLFFCAGVLFLAGSGAFYYTTTPKSFGECILMNIGNAKSDGATKVVYRVCKDMFGDSEKVEPEKVKKILSLCANGELDYDQKDALKELIERDLI